MEETKVIYSVKEVAGLLHVDVHTVYKLINAGVLPAIKLGTLKVTVKALDRFLEDYNGMDLSDLNHITKYAVS
jgi:excisionase family DNA binding protein